MSNIAEVKKAVTAFEDLLKYTEEHLSAEAIEDLQRQLTVLHGVVDLADMEIPEDPTTGRRGLPSISVSGVPFWPLDMRPEDVRPREIAHSASHICRYNGQAPRFLSVAEHTLRVAALAVYLAPVYWLSNTNTASRSNLSTT